MHCVQIGARFGEGLHDGKQVWAQQRAAVIRQHPERLFDFFSKGLPAQGLNGHAAIESIHASRR